MNCGTINPIRTGRYTSQESYKKLAIASVTKGTTVEGFPTKIRGKLNGYEC